MESPECDRLRLDAVQRVVFADQLLKELSALESSVADVHAHVQRQRFTRAGMHAQSCFQHLGRIVWLCAEGAIRGWDRDGPQ